jgi:diguanylate cyclase (GGDEF)-like protein
MGGGRPAEALDPARRMTQYVHESWRVGDGLPQGSIQAMVQAIDGYVWVGTLEGLARFDGLRFTVFDRGNTPELPHNDVQALHEDGAGRLWIGTWGGLAVREGGNIRAVALPGDAAGVPVNAIAEDERGDLWIATPRGLVRRSRGELRRFGVGDGLPSDDVTTLLRDAAGRLWVGTSAGLAQLRDGRFEAATGAAGHDGIVSLYEDREGTVWVGRVGGGVDQAPGGDMARLFPTPGPPNERILAVRQDRDGNHWFGTASHGLLRLSRGQWESFSTAEGLTFDAVMTLFEDREGALWVGTDGGGLDRFRDGKVWTLTAADGLPHEVLWTVYEDRKGTLWIGTGGGGLVRMADGRFRQLAAAEGLPSRRFMAMAEDAGGTLWVGGWGDGLFRVEGERLVRVRPDPAFITALLADADGTLWIGTEKEGLVGLRDGGVLRLTARDGLASDNVRTLHRDRRGDLWVGTDGGLSRLGGGRSGRPVSYTARNGLPHNTVTEIHEDAAGGLWLGTYGGGLASLRGERFVTVSRAQGLFDDVIYRILEDGQGRFWMSSNKGLFAVARAELEELVAGRRASVRSSAYGIPDGMRNIECQGFFQPAGWKTRDGRLLFPTLKGLVMVEPERMRLNPLPPPVALEAVRANAQPVPLAENVVLPPDRTDLEFQYTALSLLQPEKVAFRYRLEGFDERWVDAGARRVAYYTNVPPGAYRFLVQAANNDGVWNQHGAALGIVLRPRYYQTPLFAALCVAAGVLGVFGLHRLRVAGLRRRQREAETLVEERTRELRDNERRLQDAYEQLALLATEDALTRVHNRRTFESHLENEWRRMARAQAPLAVIMIDIDHFKRLNDAYGHPTGDECLKRVAGALQRCIQRPADLVARYGGEEFAVLLPGTGLEGGRVLGERMRAEVEALAIEHRASALGRVTISVGLAATVPVLDQPPQALVALADRALYRAKDGGRNRLVAEG